MSFTQKKGTVIVGMSGGVDSAVAALLLQKEGYEVIGVFMKNFSAASIGLSGPEAARWEQQCPWEQDARDMQAVCRLLNVPYYTLNFEKEYKEDVLDYFFRESAAGRTPNPDIVCNSAIKFKVFLEKARKMGADFVATGHYARRVEKNGRYEIHIPKDREKDQTYFLYTLQQEQLRAVLWPLASLHKKQVRALARKHRLPNCDKPDSQGICFVGEVDIRDFLATKIARNPGPIVTLKGEVLGRHIGLAFYTIGQREGLGIGGRKEPLYVVNKDTAQNRLIVASGEDHPALFAEGLIVSDLRWVSGVAPQLPMECTARIRYRQAPQAARIQYDADLGRTEVRFSEPQRAVTPGQSVVFYRAKKMLGGGVIEQKLGHFS